MWCHVERWHGQLGLVGLTRIEPRERYLHLALLRHADRDLLQRGVELRGQQLPEYDTLALVPNHVTNT